MKRKLVETEKVELTELTQEAIDHFKIPLEAVLLDFLVANLSIRALRETCREHLSSLSIEEQQSQSLLV